MSLLVWLVMPVRTAGTTPIHRSSRAGASKWARTPGSWNTETRVIRASWTVNTCSVCTTNFVRILPVGDDRRLPVRGHRHAPPALPTSAEGPHHESPEVGDAPVPVPHRRHLEHDVAMQQPRQPGDVGGLERRDKRRPQPAARRPVRAQRRDRRPPRPASPSPAATSCSPRPPSCPAARPPRRRRRRERHATRVPPADAGSSCSAATTARRSWDRSIAASAGSSAIRPSRTSGRGCNHGTSNPGTNAALGIVECRAYVRRQWSALARLEGVQAGVGGDPVEPRPHRRAGRVVPLERPPGPGQGLLQHILRVVHRAEHPVAEDEQLADAARPPPRTTRHRLACEPRDRSSRPHRAGATSAAGITP